MPKYNTKTSDNIIPMAFLSIVSLIAFARGEILIFECFFVILLMFIGHWAFRNWIKFKLLCLYIYMSLKNRISPRKRNDIAKYGRYCVVTAYRDGIKHQIVLPYNSRVGRKNSTCKVSIVMDGKEVVYNHFPGIPVQLDSNYIGADSINVVY